MVTGFLRTAEANPTFFNIAHVPLNNYHRFFIVVS